MKLKNTLLLCLLGAPLAVSAAHIERFPARYQEVTRHEGRVWISADFTSTNQTQWNVRGNAGVTGDGRVVQSFARFKLDDRNLFAAITGADQVTINTGLVQKEKNRTVDPVDGGHDVDVYLALDPNGQFVPPGEMPSVETAFDWDNQFGWGYEHTVYLGRVLQSHTPAPASALNENDQIPVDSEWMDISFDITGALRAWADQGLLTEQSTVAVGFVQRAAEVVDDQGNPRFDDPNLYIHSQMLFEIGNAFIATITGLGPAMGPGAFADYPLGEDGWLFAGDPDTGAAWLGWVFVDLYPWTYSQSLNRFLYVTEPAGWVYIPR